MKRITIVALGSRGDVQPFIALADYMHRNGYRVRIATNDDFAPLITSYGLDHISLGSNVQDMINTPEGQAMIHSGNVIAAVRYFMKQAQRRMSETQWEAWQACRESDALIYSGLVMAGRSIAEKMNIPSMPVFMVPAYPTRHLPVPQSNLPASPVWNALLYEIFIQFSWLIFRNGVNRFRTERLDLPPAPWGYKHLLNDPQIPVLLAYSKHVLPRPADWRDHIHISGYWFLPAPPHWTPPHDLVKFLESGPPPIYIGFGSMADRNAESKTRAILNAILETKERAVFVKGWGGLDTNDLPENVFMLDSIPHEWLFRRVSMVIHHGGAGTTAAGLRAGVPSILVPHFGDQFFWGNRIHQLGVGPRPIPAQKLDAHNLAYAIHTCLNDSSIKERAAHLGKQIESEDGLEYTVALLETMFEG